MSLVDAAIAANRFGLGARPGDLQAIAGDPRGWLKAQIQTPAAPPADTPLTRAGLELLISIQTAPDDAVRTARQQDLKLVRDRDRIACIQGMLAGDAPFRERLVKFWTNHFTVSYAQSYVMPFAAAYEAEAIRPHATGRFRDLLGAVAHHPAMLFYLDNVKSTGPNSAYGKRVNVGLNENLGRELMELHTLGVDGGYTQDDVRAMTLILTGWSVAVGKDPPGTIFIFRPTAHEPGAKTLLGKTYPEAGQDEGEAALDTLARHPSTARHVTGQLARHLVADTPPQALVDRLARVFLDTDGDLGAVTQALVDSREAWAPERRKFKTPVELYASCLRGFGIDTVDENAPNWVRRLGQQLYNAPSPQGWPDREADWLAPELVMQRIEWSYQAIPRVTGDQPPVPFAEAILGPTLSDRTKGVLMGAPSAREGIALALLSPEFQRR